MKNRKETIQQLTQSSLDEIIQIRRKIHQNPELSFKEYKTSEYICSLLDAWGVKYRKGIVKTGIVAEIDGASPGKVIGIRADMDALPIQEETGLEFASQNPGAMHACGHDVHTSCLLGTIKVLNEIKDQLQGKIKFVFQPGEERLPGGAKLMLEEKLFGDEEPEIMIAQHVYPEMDAGRIGIKDGHYMASADEVFIKVKGKGGHAALPERLKDPVLMASHILIALQQVVSRANKPGLPSVLSFGKIEANGAVNIIPNEVRLEGTFRTMDETWRKKAHGLIRSIAEHTAKAMGGEAEVEILRGYPVLYNDPKLAEQLENLASDFLGEDNVEKLDVRMTAEDFAYFSQQYPSVLFRLGTARHGDKIRALHTSDFVVDESAIETSVSLLSWFASCYLMD